MLSRVYTQTKASKNGGKYTSCSRKESGKESRTGGTCNKLLNAHSLLREICVGELTATKSKKVSFKVI